jgi:hypothetical protein
MELGEGPACTWLVFGCGETLRIGAGAGHASGDERVRRVLGSCAGSGHVVRDRRAPRVCFEGFGERDFRLGVFHSRHGDVTRTMLPMIRAVHASGCSQVLLIPDTPDIGLAIPLQRGRHLNASSSTPSVIHTCPAKF